MSDIADNADDQVAAFTQYAISHKQPEGPKHTGFCANCGEVVLFPKRWCDSDCLTEYERRARRGNGKN